MNKLSIAVLAMITLVSCGDGITNPNTNASVQSCVATATGSSNAACGDIQITVTATPSPSPSPNSYKCFKDVPVYQEIMVQVTAGIQPNQTQASYGLALVSGLNKLGFKTSTSGLPSDEVAIKIVDGFSETYDWWRADNTPHVLYQETCNPARF